MSNCGCNVDSVMQATTAPKAGKKQIEIQLLYLDLDVCEPCQKTDNSLDEALNEVNVLLQKSGYSINVEKIHIDSIDKATTHQFLSSPTIRVNGYDLQLDFKEDHCVTCSSLTEGAEVYCRSWVYKGETFISPPKQMIIDAVLESISDKEPGVAENNAIYQVPENIKNFFFTNKQQSSCCSDGCS